MRLLVVGLSHRTAPVELRECVDFARGGARRGAEGAGRARRRARRRWCCRRATAPRSTRSRRRPTRRPTHRPVLQRIPPARAPRDGRPPLHAERRRRGAPSVQGRGRARLAGRRRAADPRPGQGGVHDRERPAVHRPTPQPAVPLVVRRSASASAARPGSAKGRSRSATRRLRWRRKIFGNLSGLGVLILGAGEMAKLTAMHLKAQQVRHMTIASRTLAAAESLAAQLDATAAAVDRSRSRPGRRRHRRHRHRRVRTGADAARASRR